MTKTPSRKTLILFVTISAVWAHWSIYTAKFDYEQKTRAEFESVLDSALENYKKPFWLKEIYDFTWDEICVFYQIDDSYPVWALDDYIRHHNLKTTHWTQYIPRSPIIDAIELGTGLTLNDYHLAFIFTKKDTVVKVVKISPNLPHGNLSDQEVGDSICYPNIKIEKKKNPNSNDYYFILTDK